MRRFLLLLLLIIIIVSINWFAETRAGSLQDLTDDEKQALLHELQQREKSTSPKSYDSEVTLGLPNASVTPTAPGSMPDYDRLQPFGHDLFGAPSGEEIPPNDIASSSDYILGPGDNVIIYLWGRVESEYNLTLDREGKLVIPKVGELSVWGMTLDEFREYARTAFSKVYSDFSLTVSLGKIRSIRIYMTGEVVRPGAYTVSSLTSLYNALFLAGGPTANGSMRHIKLMRQGKPVADVDIYEFLLQGDNSLDVRLEAGDAVFVPIVGPKVALRGHVRRPAVYELKNNETVRELLALAGEPTAEAYLDRVMLERVSRRNEWEVIDLDLKEGSPDGAMVLMDGDRMTVYSVFDARQNMVALFGQVKHPGFFERNDSTTVSTLIAAAQLQPYDVYYDRANLFRRHSDWRTEIIPIDLNRCLAGDTLHDLLLQDRDSLYVYSLQEVGWNQSVYIDGEVKHPGQYPLYQNMTAADLIFLAGSSTPSASRLQAEMARFDSTGSVSLEYVKLERNRLASTFLEKGDRLYIRRLPEYQLHPTVKVDGEIRYPGEYVLASREETLYQLLQRCGGFTSKAFADGLILERPSIENNLKRLHIPQLLEKSGRITEDSSGHLVRESVVDYEANQVNRIVLNMDRILNTDGQEGDVVMEPGDRVFVPATPTGISVMGAVGANGTIRYAEGRNVEHYIKRAGNLTPQSDKKNVRLIRANGEVLAGGGTLHKKVRPGDVIVVPTKIHKDRQWGKTMTTVLTTTASVLTSILLINKL